MIIRNLIFFLFGVLVINACNEIPDCQLIDETAYFNVAFLDRDTTTLAEALVIYNLTSEKGDSIIFSNDTLLVSGVSLYLNPYDTVSTFYFETDRGFDTLKVSYQTLYKIISEECGPVQEFLNLDTLDHTFDSISLENSFLNREINVNIALYFD